MHTLYTDFTGFAQGIVIFINLGLFCLVTFMDVNEAYSRITTNPGGCFESRGTFTNRVRG